MFLVLPDGDGGKLGVFLRFILWDVALPSSSEKQEVGVEVVIADLCAQSHANQRTLRYTHPVPFHVNPCRYFLEWTGLSVCDAWMEKRTAASPEQVPEKETESTLHKPGPALQKNLESPFQFSHRFLHWKRLPHVTHIAVTLVNLEVGLREVSTFVAKKGAFPLSGTKILK